MWWTFRKKITAIFIALQLLGIGVGSALALLAWKQMQTIDHIQQVSWPTADAVMETRALFLQEETSMACAHCHWDRYTGMGAPDSLKALHLDLLRRLSAGPAKTLAADFEGLENQRHAEFEALWPDLAVLSAHMKKIDPSFARQHALTMTAVDSTSRQLDALLREAEDQVEAEMANQNQRASLYAYAGMISLGLLGLVMIGATWHFGNLVRRQVSDPIERLAAEMEAVQIKGPSYRVSIPAVAELEVLARTLNQTLSRLETSQAERRQLDRHLVQAERLASVGVVAAGIVHNLRSPLSAIVGFGDILTLEHPELAEAQIIVEEALRMNQMIEEILARGRKTKDLEPVDLNALLERELDFLQTDLVFKHQVEKKLALASGLPLVHCVYTDLSQVFANLLQNAVDAMRQQNRKRLKVSTASAPDHVAVEIVDTGCGIPEEARAHLFEPFFTTKSSGAGAGGAAGTGLGLYTARQLLETYQATIEVESEVGAGTTFRVKIPLVQQS